MSLMEKTFDIFLGDLVPETKKEILKFLKIEKPEDGNFDIFPLATITSQDVEEFNQEVRKKYGRKKRQSRWTSENPEETAERIKEGISSAPLQACKHRFCLLEFSR